MGPAAGNRCCTAMTLYLYENRFELMYALSTEEAATPSNRGLFINLIKSNRRGAKIFPFWLLLLIAFCVCVRARNENKEATHFRAERSCTPNTCSHLFCYNSLSINGVHIRINDGHSENGGNGERKIVEIVKRQQKQTHFSHSVQYNFISCTLTHSLIHSLTRTHFMRLISFVVRFCYFYQQKNTHSHTRAHQAKIDENEWVRVRETRIRANSKWKKSENILCGYSFACDTLSEPEPVRSYILPTAHHSTVFHVQ